MLCIAQNSVRALVDKLRPSTYRVEPFELQEIFDPIGLLIESRSC